MHRKKHRMAIGIAWSVVAAGVSVATWGQGSIPGWGYRVLAVGPDGGLVKTAANGILRPAIRSADAEGRSRESASPYSLSFSQLAIGASSGQSGDYAIEDVLGLGVSDAIPQHSAHYSVVNPIASAPSANDGLAIGHGTTMHLSWNEDGKPMGALGYDVRRSASDLPGSYSKVNAAAICAPCYDDPDLEKGTYFYVVYLIDARGRPQQWTSPFYGTVTGGTATQEEWMLYE